MCVHALLLVRAGERATRLKRAPLGQNRRHAVVKRVGGVKLSVASTSFPQAIGMAGSFNRSLLQLVGTVIGDEARAQSSPFVGGTFWAPNVNLVHDPRWVSVADASFERTPPLC